MPFPVIPLFSSSEDTQIAPLSVTGAALLETSSVDELKKFARSLDGEALVVPTTFDVQTVIDLLNNGASKAFVSIEQYQELVAAGVPSARLALKISTASEVSEYTAGAYVLPSSTPSTDIATASDKGGKIIYVFFTEAADAAIVEAVAKAQAISVVPAAQLTTGPSSTGKISISDIFISALTTDRQDGLYTTLVSDPRGSSLGLVYSSKESIAEAIKTKAGVYQSRRHGLWRKGATSGATQELIRLDKDCDSDCLKFVVQQAGTGFCHLETDSCFGDITGLARLEKTLQDRLANAPEGSYTKRLFTDETLLNAKIKEEADELIEAKTKDEIAWECADLFYFALTRCVKNGVSLQDIERNLDLKGLKITRRKGDAKPQYLEKKEEQKKEAAPKPVVEEKPNDGPIRMGTLDASTATKEEVAKVLTRPVQKTADIMKLVNPIIETVRSRGDAGLLELTAKFDGVKLESPILRAPFSPELYEISDELKDAIDLSIANVEKFHVAQLQTETLRVETQPGVICSRFARPIEAVGLYVPGGTAVLPSTAIMLGVPAKAAGCQNIILASPPRKDGSLSPEVVYVAHKIGAQGIVLAGGAQAVAAMAYGTESIPKVDKILGPGNQFVTAAKMYVQNDTTALCSIDMPAGPSEVLVICDDNADPDFVAIDLLSQAEHGVDSQVILLGVDLSTEKLKAIEDSLHRQAMELPRVEIVRKCIEHSTTLLVPTYEQAFALSNQYAPEHLILQIENAGKYVDLVQHAGSVFVGAYSPESCGDYSSGTNHTLPTYGYAKMYSGVNTATFQKFLTSQDVTPEGLKNIGFAVMSVAKVEGLDAHRNAVKVRMDKLGLLPSGFE